MSLGRDIDDVLDPLLAAFERPLTAELVAELAEIHASATVQMLQYEAEKSFVVYHSTWAKNVAGIKATGLAPAPHLTSPKWYMVTDSWLGASRYAMSEDAVVIRYAIPKDQVNKYLWTKAKGPTEYYGNQYAIRTPLPKELITQVAPANQVMMNAASLPFEGPPMTKAVSWAQQHAATLVTRMDTETKKQLAQVISDGIANKRGPGGLTTDIKRSLGWMGRGKPSAIKGLTQQGRAMMIARTETAAALTQGSLDAMNDMGVTGKEVVTNDPCEICQGNAAVGVIPVDQAFPSGEMGPPFHPNCECALAPVMMERK